MNKLLKIILTITFPFWAIPLLVWGLVSDLVDEILNTLMNQLKESK